MLVSRNKNKGKICSGAQILFVFVLPAQHITMTHRIARITHTETLNQFVADLLVRLLDCVAFIQWEATDVQGSL